MVTQEEANQYLDDLRESGDTNMFGAGIYLMDEFSIGLTKAHKLLAVWMETFSERHPKSPVAK